MEYINASSLLLLLSCIDQQKVLDGSSINRTMVGVVKANDTASTAAGNDANIHDPMP
jgi:hypothetical protein